MKLWPTTTKNKCFVKILWHLLGECVKVTVLLVCSICIFFFSIIDLYSFFLYIKVRMHIQCFATVHTTFSIVYLPCNFGEPLYLFLVLNSSYRTRRHCSYSSYIFFFQVFCLYFFFINIVILTQQILQYFHNYWGVNFL